MRTVLVSMLLVLAMLAAAAMFITTDGLEPFRVDGWRSTGDLVLAEVVLVPLAVAWMLLELLNAISPRRVFDSRHRGIAARAAMGLALAATWMLAQTAGLWLLAGAMPDSAISALSSATSVLLCFPFLSRCRVGHCINCRYDLRATEASQPCPECGLTMTRCVHGRRSGSLDRAAGPVLDPHPTTIHERWRPRSISTGSP